MFSGAMLVVCLYCRVNLCSVNAVFDIEYINIYIILDIYLAYMCMHTGLSVSSADQVSSWVWAKSQVYWSESTWQNTWIQYGWAPHKIGR